MSIAAVSPVTTFAPHTLSTARAPIADAAPSSIRREQRIEIAPVAAASAISSGSALAARAAYDCRVTGAASNVQSFDRIAMIEEGFAHLREIFEGARQQAEETFGGFKPLPIDQAMAAGRLDTRA